MCVTNIYTDCYPDGQEGSFRQQTYCSFSYNGRPCQSNEILTHLPRHIKYGEPSSAQIFSQTPDLQTPPRSSSSSQRPSSSSMYLDTDDGATNASHSVSGTYSSISAGGTHRKHHKGGSHKGGLPKGEKSRAFLNLWGVNFGPRLEKESEKRKRKEREARKDKIIYVDESVSSSPQSQSSQSFSYTRPVPGYVSHSRPGARNVHFSSNPQYSPPQIITTHAPNTPPVIHDAWPNTNIPSPITRDVQPPHATTIDAFPQESPAPRPTSPIIIQERERRPHATQYPVPVRSVSPVSIPERERRPHATRTVIVENHNYHRGRSPSPPPAGAPVRPSNPPPAPPAPAAAAVISERERSKSRTRRESSPPTPIRRRDASTIRRARHAARDEEIRNRPVRPREPEILLEREEVRIRRERDLMGIAPRFGGAEESTRRLMGGLQIEEGMMGRLRERQVSLGRRGRWE